jgi:oligoendopeptidase F
MFPAITDPSVQIATNELAERAERFASGYQGKITTLPAEILLKAIKDFEEYCIKLDRITTFSYLSFQANMTLRDTQSLNDRVNKLKAKLDKTLAFFNIELGALISKKPELINEPILRDYRHFLERLRREVSHQLCEVEEKLVIEKDQFGIRAWEEFQGKWLNTMTFEVEVEGKKKALSFDPHENQQ